VIEGGDELEGATAGVSMVSWGATAASASRLENELAVELGVVIAKEASPAACT
jgi:hypothetical protein